LLRTREDIDESYVYSFICGDLSKGDTKKVVEKKEHTQEDVKKMIMEKFKQNVPILKIKQDLKDINVQNDLIEGCLVDIAKEQQAKNVENLRKKRLLVTELTAKQSLELRIAQRKGAATGGAAGGAGGAAGAKKDDKKKK